MQKSLDEVLYGWACSICVPLGGLPSYESEMRAVKGMMYHGLKLLQMSHYLVKRTVDFRKRRHFPFKFSRKNKMNYD